MADFLVIIVRDS